MAFHKITKGLELPITGKPHLPEDGETVAAGPSVSRVAVIAADFIGMKPRMLVQPGDSVQRGSPLFEDRKRPGVVHTSPGAGTVLSVNRGAKRALISVIIELNDRERAGTPADEDFFPFESYTGDDLSSLTRDQARDLLVESGAWTGLRARPFSRVPPIDGTPSSIFVTAMDTHPLGADVVTAMQGDQAAFEAGLSVLTKLTDGPVHLCRAPNSGVGPGDIEDVIIQEFTGPHPAGLAGTHIHFVDPVNRQKFVWYVNYADVQLIGRLATTGKLHVDRVISLAGPMVEHPRLITTRLGASVDELVDGQTFEGSDCRTVSGSVLGGRTAQGDKSGFLGRYALQVSVLEEDRKREFLGWLTPGESLFSLFPIYVSKMFPDHMFGFTTNTNGSHRAMVPIGMYEDVMPLDIIPTFLLRSLSAKDLEKVEQLGALELDEEDLALCTMVCPGKNDWGAILRDNLNTIEREG
jgi:Na+-transporting NADH:ubiquinone oxidoreductase subunit A